LHENHWNSKVNKTSLLAVTTTSPKSCFHWHEIVCGGSLSKRLQHSFASEPLSLISNCLWGLQCPQHLCRDVHPNLQFKKLQNQLLVVVVNINLRIKKKTASFKSKGCGLLLTKTLTCCVRCSKHVMKITEPSPLNHKLDQNAE